MHHFDKFIFLSDCKKFYKNIEDAMTKIGIYQPGKLEQIPVDFERPVCLVNTTENYMHRQIEGAMSLPSKTDKSVLITTKRSVYSEEGKYYENVLTIVKFGDVVYSKTGRPIQIPDEAVKLAGELTPTDYKYREMGWSVKTQDAVVKCFPNDITDTWDWGLNDRFGHHSFGKEGIKTIEAAICALYAHWSYGSSLEFPLTFSQLSFFSDWIVSEIKTNLRTIPENLFIVANDPISKSWAPITAAKLSTGVLLLHDGSSHKSLPSSSPVLIFTDGPTCCKDSASKLVEELEAKDHKVAGIVGFNSHCSHLPFKKPVLSICLF